MCYTDCGRRESSAGIVAMLQVGQSGVRISAGTREISRLQIVQSGVNPPGEGGVQRPGRDVAHSHRSNAEVKNE